MSFDPGLDALLTSLRGAQLTVGITEVLRLQRIFASLEADPSRGQAIDRRQLRAIIEAVVVKSTADRSRFDPVFDAWWSGAEALIAERERARKPPSRDPGRAPWVGAPAASSPRPRLSAAGIAIVGVASLIAAGLLLMPDPGGGGSSPSSPDADASVPDADASAPDASQQDPGDLPPLGDAGSRPKDQPPPSNVEPEIPPPPLSLGAKLLAGLARSLPAFGVAAFLWIALRRRSSLPRLDPAPARPGPTEVSLRSPPARNLELLDTPAQDMIVWGIGRFVSEEGPARIDIDRSVEATTRAAGMLSLRFRREGRHRAVWIWVDESSCHPTLERLARELTLALARAGLHVDRASYWAVPDRLTAADGVTFSPLDLEEGPEAVVVLLTDGKALSLRFDAADRRPRIADLLRRLGAWPRIAFVDFSDGRGRLQAVAGPFCIPVLPPDDAPAFLASGRPPEQSAPPERRLEGDARAWAAACALAPRPIDEETAFALRRALGLNVSPWVIQALRRESTAAGGLFDWPEPLRIRLCTWLRQAERGRGIVDPQSLLGRSLEFWRARYAAEAAERAKVDAVIPWIGTPAERSLRVERSLLDLWDRPDEAARSLYALLGTDLGEVVKARAALFAPLELEGTGLAIVLPWRLRDRPDEVRVMLQAIELGAAAGGLEETVLRERSGRFWLGIALAVGLGLGALAVSLW